MQELHPNSSPAYLFSSERLYVSDASCGINPPIDEPVSGVNTLKICENDLLKQSDIPLGWVIIDRYQETPYGKVCVAQEVYFNRLRHGPSTWYYLEEKISDSQPLSVATKAWYYKGLLHGRLYAYHFSSGTVAAEIGYYQGKRSGKSCSWTEAGVLSSVQEYIEGSPHGTLTTYHPKTGVIARSQEYRYGKRHGIDSLYHGDDGFLLFCDEWRNGVKQRSILEDLLEKGLHSSLSTAKKQRGAQSGDSNDAL